LEEIGEENSTRVDRTASFFSLCVADIGEDFSCYTGFGQKDSGFFKSLANGGKLVGRKVWVYICDARG
jgi:hypothetical protein